MTFDYKLNKYVYNIKVLVLCFVRRSHKVVENFEQLIHSCAQPDLLEMNHRIVECNIIRYPNKRYFNNKSCKNNSFQLGEGTVHLLQGKSNQVKRIISLYIVIT